MFQQPQLFYEFGPFRLEVAERLLLRDAEPVPLTPKSFELLLALVERHGHIVEKQDLMQTVWPDTFVEETNLTKNIFILRHVLGESDNGQKYIETIPKRGYRFVAPVRARTAEPGVVEDIPLSLATAGTERQDAPSRGSTVWKPRKWVKQWSVLAALLFILLLVGLDGAINFWPVRSRSAKLGPAIKSIAVLPVRPLHQDKNDE